MKISGPSLAQVDRSSDLYRLLEQAHGRIAVKDATTWGSKAAAEAAIAEAGKRDQAARRLGQGATGVLLGVPGLGTDVIEEPLPLLIVGNQLAVEVLRVPVEQYTAKVKHYCADRHGFLLLCNARVRTVWHVPGP